MLFLLSPAKSLDYETPVRDLGHTQPLFVKQSMYGVLRLLDWMQPYRLEMGTQLKNVRGVARAQTRDPTV